MATIKEILKALFFTGVGVLLAYSLTASAFTTSFSGGFETLINNFISPNVTSQAYATQIQSPLLSTKLASSTLPATGGALTKGPLQVVIEALTATGTSSPSAEIATTSASTNSQLYLQWAPVANATGYAVWIGTSTPGSERSYFMATSTAGTVNTNYNLTSTSTPTYGVLGAAGFLTTMGSASSSISTSGLIQSQQAATSTACTTALQGSMFYNTSNAHLWLCQSGAWAVIK